MIKPCSVNDLVFLSTPSARRATHRTRGKSGRRNISIHALREEGDPSCRISLPALMLFLSTPSARRATQRMPPSRRCRCNFYPRPPRGGRRFQRLQRHCS